jgi:CelD/BcsL family acetyltransferase involved in cellulose biosynthesis
MTGGAAAVERDLQSMSSVSDRAAAVRAEVFESPAALERLKDEWDGLFLAHAVEPSTSFEWTLGLARHYVRAGERFFVVRLERGGRAVGVVPLVTRRFAVLRQPCLRLTPISEIFNTHSDLLLADRSAATVDALLDALQDLGVRWDCLRMSKLLEGNSLVQRLESRARARGWIGRSGFDRATHYLPLPSTFEEYFAARSAKFRNHARRAERKLHRAGRVRVVEVTDADGFRTVFHQLLQVEQASWKEPLGTSIHALSRQTAFYREWGEAAARAGRLHVQLLTLDGTPIAHNLGCLFNGTYSYLKTSYAAAHRPLSPATYLRLRLIESLIAAGVSTLDFPGKPFDWERQWTDAVRWHVVLSIYPPTLRGRALASLERWTLRSSPERRFESAGPRPDRSPDEAD